ncbi:hypothetical protein OSB04_028563 [Centaurea solstitialis]|uniref:Uncharacterized protein n=1 Tax=Centaurea solstitialis TaxID=347529 RepID=A0AA38W0R3_9ASTR|nr:hypothetical protein OSB04_028563 [Centaurea solstitialis]
MDSIRFIQDHNKIGYLTKDSHSEGFEDVVDFLASSNIAYAATINPTIYITHMQDFWANVVIEESEGVKSFRPPSVELTDVPMDGDTYQSSALGHKVFSNMKRPAQGSNDIFTPIVPYNDGCEPPSRGAPSSSGSKPTKPISHQLEHSPSDSFQRDTHGVSPHSSVKKVPSKEKDGHVVGDAQTTDVAQGLHQDSLNIAKTPTTATPIKQSKGGPRCQETKGAASASARLKTSVKKLKDPVRDVNTPKPGEGRYNYHDLMADLKVIADDLRAHDANFEAHDRRHASHEDRLDMLEKVIDVQNQLIKDKDAMLAEFNSKFKSQGVQMARMHMKISALKRRYSTLDSFTKGERRSKIKGEQKKRRKVVNEETEENEIIGANSEFDNAEPEVVVTEKEGVHMPEVGLETTEAEAKGEFERETEKVVEKETEKRTEMEVNEDEVTIAELLLKLPKVIPKAKGVVIKEPEVIKEKGAEIDPKDKGKNIVQEETKSDSDGDERRKPVVDPVVENQLSEAFIQKLAEEEERQRKKNWLEWLRKTDWLLKNYKRKAKATKKKPVKKASKKATPKAVSEKRRIMVRYLAGALGKPVQYFAKWDLKKVEQKYNATREVMHQQALEEEEQDQEDVSLVHRKRKRDQVTSAEGNADTTAGAAADPVKENETAQQVNPEGVEKEVEKETAEKESEVQVPKTKRKKSIAKKKQKVKMVEETSDISNWLYFEDKEIEVFKVFRSTGQSEIFASIHGIFRKLPKADLKKMYEIGCTKENEDFEETKLLNENLQFMFAFLKARDDLKKRRARDQNDSIGEGRVVSWSTYNNRVFSVTFEKGRQNQKSGLTDLDKELLEKMKQQILDINERYFDDQIVEVQPKKWIEWGVSEELNFFVRWDDGSEQSDPDLFKILEVCTRDNLREMHVLGLKMNDTVVDDRIGSEKDLKMKSAMECLFWLFEPSRISDVLNQACEVVDEWRWFDKCRTLQGMVNVQLSMNGEPTKPARLLIKKIKTYLKIRLKNLAHHNIEASRLILIPAIEKNCTSDLSLFKSDWGFGSRSSPPVIFSGEIPATALFPATHFFRRPQPFINKLKTMAKRSNIVLDDNILLFQILPRLPVRSLGRLRCVYKQ